MKRKLNILRFASYIAILVLALIIAVGSTFSWYNRTVKTTNTAGSKLTYSISGAKVNSYKAKLSGTYLGTEDKGRFTYSKNPVETSVTITPGQQVVYFKTVIENGNYGDALVSLYLEGLNYSTALGNSIRIGVINPEKAHKETITTTVDSKQTVDYVCISDNILVPNNSPDSTKDDTYEVYWFIKFADTASGNSELDLGKLHIVYN